MTGQPSDREITQVIGLLGWLHPDLMDRAPMHVIRQMAVECYLEARRAVERPSVPDAFLRAWESER